MLFAINPIPSYNISVYHTANLQENSRGSKRPLSLRGTCYMVAKVNELTSNSAMIWVYSLDGRDMYGPYTVYAGQELQVEIDDRDWGVLVQSSFEVEVSVWITEEDKGAMKQDLSRRQTGD